MKLRSTLSAVVFGLSTLAAVAQTGPQNLRIKEEGRTEFKPHWYMQVQAGASHTVGEASFGDLISPAMGIYGGYQFCKLLGVRAGLTGWESKGAWANPKTVYKYKYLQGNIDATLDLANLFSKYNPQRFFNPYIFLGIGFNGAFDNDEAVAINDSGKKLEYLWRDNKFTVAGRTGLGANFRVCDNLFINLEANANVLSDHYNSKKAGNADWQFNALAGLTFKFGKTHKVIPPVYYEPEPVYEKPAPKPEPVVEPEPAPVVVEALQQDIFFLINSYEIRETETAKIERLVSYLNEHQNAKIEVCGYADKGTGNATINERISKKRANSVTEALLARGIAAERITVSFKGDTIQPFSANDENRVCICIAE